MVEPYGVIVEEYCEKHYIKDFVKKYSQGRWNVSKSAIVSTVRNPEKAVKAAGFNTVVDKNDTRICKANFKPHGTNMSAKKSGWRFIVEVDSEAQLSRVLLIYNKSHVKGGHETVWWKGEVKDAYPDLANLL